MTVGSLQRRALGGVVLAALLGFASAAVAGTTLKTTVVKSAGVSFKYPGSWTTLARDPKALAAQQRQLAKHNPKIALNAAQQAQFLQSAKFRAVDIQEAAAGRFASNVSVQVVDQGGFPTSLDEFTAGARPEYNQEGLSLVGTSSVPVRGATAYRADARATVTVPDGRTLATRVSQLFIPRNAGNVTITVATSDDAAGTQLIDAILGSVRRL